MLDSFRSFMCAFLSFLLIIAGICMLFGLAAKRNSEFEDWLAPRGGEFETLAEAHDAYGKWLEREEYRRFLAKTREARGAEAVCVNGRLILPDGKFVILSGDFAQCGKQEAR